jgi:sensor histidine kinase YesM
MAEAEVATTKAWIIYLTTFLVWVGIGVVFLMQSYFYTVSFGREMDWAQQGPYRLSGYVVWGLISYPFYQLYCVIDNKALSRLAFIGLLSLIALLLAPLHRLVSMLIEIGFKNVVLDLELSLSQVIAERAVALAGGALDSLFILSILLFVFSGLRKRVELKKQQRYLQRFQHQLTQSRLESLQSQLQPHFLFNTLNGITALITAAPLKAESIIAKLSRILRYSLDRSQQHETKIEDELAIIRDYLDIEKIRLGERLKVELMIEPETLNQKIPTLLLQPLIENAIQYGISPYIKPGTLQLNIRQSDNCIEITIEDSGEGIGSDCSHGIGLSNTLERLETLYDQQASLIIAPSPLGGAMISIRIPLA